MKWLATFLCLLVTVPAFAEELPSGTVKLPSSMICGEFNPNLSIEGAYGELPFLEGDGQVLSPDAEQAYFGKVRMFLDPEDGSYTIFIDINDIFTCLVVTGDKMQPVIYGNEL